MKIEDLSKIQISSKICGVKENLFELVFFVFLSSDSPAASMYVMTSCPPNMMGFLLKILDYICSLLSVCLNQTQSFLESFKSLGGK